MKWIGIVLIPSIILLAIPVLARITTVKTVLFGSLE
jgi:hypothetical protein